MGNFSTRFNKELIGIDQVITGGGTIRTFVRAIGPKGSTGYDNVSVIPVNTVEEMVTSVKFYIDLEITKEGRKTANKETKKGTQKGKMPDQRPPKAEYDDQKCRPRIPRLNREVHGFFRPLTQEIPVGLA